MESKKKEENFFSAYLMSARKACQKSFSILYGENYDSQEIAITYYEGSSINDATVLGRGVKDFLTTAVRP